MTTHMYKHIVIMTITLFFVFASAIFGQRITINPGVDTTDQDVKSVTALWMKYLKSKPTKENIKKSPFWAESEKEKYAKVDQLLNAVNSDYPTYSLGNATILYVKPTSAYYEIKTLFSWTNNEDGVNVLCITSVFAKKENETYTLYNALSVNSKNWKSEKLGSVTFHFPPSHLFDRGKATQLVTSIEELTRQWNLETIPIDYYFAATYEEIQHLRGLDYSAGMGNKNKPSGMADLDTKTVFAGGLGENYFHEVVHLYLNERFPKSPLVEGLAVFYGGSMGYDLKWHLTRLDEYLIQHPSIDLKDINKAWFMDNFTNPNSTIQGLLCYISFKNGGLEKLQKLMTYEDTYTAIEKEFGIKKDGLNQYLRAQIKLNKN